jgi:hypothetical protein
MPFNIHSIACINKRFAVGYLLLHSTLQETVFKPHIVYSEHSSLLWWHYVMGKWFLTFWRLRSLHLQASLLWKP